MKRTDIVRKTFSSASFPVFTAKDVLIALSKTGPSPGYTNLLLHKLIKSGEALRITKGFYTMHREIFVVGFAFRPFYYGMESALALMGMSDQGSNPVIMTSRNVRTGVRIFDGRNYRIQRVKSQYMFGYKLMRYGEFSIPVSDPEKTLIDMLYFRKQITVQQSNAIIKSIDAEKLQRYLEHYDERTQKRVKYAIQA